MKNTISKTFLGYFILIALLICAYPIAYKMSKDVVYTRIDYKERITTGSGESISGKYLIYTEDEVFENTDDLLFFKSNSSDFQNNLKIDTMYRLEVAGWRVPFLSLYRNVVDYENKN